MKTRSGKTLIISAAICSLIFVLSGTAEAHGSVDFNLSIGVPAAVYGPVYAPIYAPPPDVVYAPRPVYYPPPVYYSPAYYYPSEPWEVRRQREWRRHEWREEHRRHERHGDDD